MGKLVGREKELALLAETAVRSVSGPAAAIVIGDPGSGKSRLLSEARARTRHRRSFAVIGYEPEKQVPLAAAAGLLRALMEVPQYGPLLESLLLGREHQAAPLEPVRIFEAAYRALQISQPPVLVIDDLQWVDDLSIALCHYLIRAASESRQNLVVFGATRPGGAGVDLVQALPAERVSWIELGPLGREEAVELVGSLDASIEHSVAADMWKRANGSPFWLQLLASTRSHGVGPGQLLTRRLRGAGTDAIALLDLLAVVGRPVAVGEAARLAEWPITRLTDAVVELCDRGVVIEAAGVLRLTHDLIRELVITDLPADARQRIHQQMAEELERTAESDLQLLREALEHRRAAGMPTLDLGLRLARSSRRRLLGSRGLRLLGSIADEADPVAAEAIELHAEVAELATELGEHEYALARWRLVAERLNKRRRRAWALLSAAQAAYRLSRREETLECLAASREAGSGDPVLELEHKITEAAIRLWLDYRASEGPARVREVVAAATRLASHAGGVEMLNSRARRTYLDALKLESEVAVQELDDATRLRSGQAREAAARGFDLEALLSASVETTAALKSKGRMEEALARARSTWDEANRHVLPRVAVEAGTQLSELLRDSGRLSDAEATIGQTLELAHRVGDVPQARHRVTKVACSIALELGQPLAALERFERETAKEPSPHQLITFHGDLALWYARLTGSSSTAAVHEHLDAGRTCFETVGCARCGAELLLLAAEALARVGERSEARRMLAAWDDRRDKDDLHAHIRLHVGALSEGDAATRAAALAEVAARADKSPYRLRSAWIRLDIGLALTEEASEGAAAELDRAVAVAAELGATTVRQLAEKELRSLGVRTWHRAEAGAPLTTREQDVARLVAGGATNKEIAGILFLAPKTVERHISNVFRKIGVRNRAELAARLNR